LRGERLYKVEIEEYSTVIEEMRILIEDRNE